MENWSKPLLSLHLLNLPGGDDGDDDYDKDDYNDKDDHEDDNYDDDNDDDGDSNDGDIDDEDDDSSDGNNWYRPQQLHPQCNRPPPEALPRTISP